MDRDAYGAASGLVCGIGVLAFVTLSVTSVDDDMANHRRRLTALPIFLAKTVAVFTGSCFGEFRRRTFD